MDSQTLQKTLNQHLHFSPEEGKIKLSGNRMMMFNQAAVGAFRKIIFEQVGEPVARLIFAKFGYESAIHDYQTLDQLFPELEEREKLDLGPLMHAWSGLVKVIPDYFHADREASKFIFKGRWINSHEALSHLEIFGRSTHPVCFSLTGYGSAWCSQFFGTDLLEIETKCLACGDDHCEWEVRPWNEWGPEADPWKKSLTDTDRSVIAKLSDQQKKIDHLKANLDKIIAQRIADSSTKLRTLCHDISTPLQLAISNLQESLASGDQLTTKTAAWSLSQAQNVVHRFQKTQLDSDGKLEIERKPVDFATLMDESLALVNDRLSAKKILPEIQADRGIFAFTDPGIARDHILLNILTNAIKFSPAESKITIHAVQIAPGQILMKIRDQGLGMPDQLLREVFDGKRNHIRRGTAGETGTGYGLSLAKFYTERLGGEIWLDSTMAGQNPINCGTNVSLKL